MTVEHVDHGVHDRRRAITQPVMTLITEVAATPVSKVGMTFTFTTPMTLAVVTEVLFTQL